MGGCWKYDFDLEVKKLGFSLTNFFYWWSPTPYFYLVVKKLGFAISNFFSGWSPQPGFKLKGKNFGFPLLPPPPLFKLLRWVITKPWFWSNLVGTKLGFSLWNFFKGWFTKTRFLSNQLSWWWMQTIGPKSDMTLFCITCRILLYVQMQKIYCFLSSVSCCMQRKEFMCAFEQCVGNL